MNVSSHYIPRFILKGFGHTVTCFHIPSGRVEYGADVSELFCEDGFYPQDLEKELSESLESTAGGLLDREHVTDFGDYVEFLRSFTHSMALRAKTSEFNEDHEVQVTLLRELLEIDNGDDRVHIDEDQRIVLDRWESLFYEGEVSVLRSVPARPFLLSDRGVVFDNRVNPTVAVCVLSPVYAVVISRDPNTRIDVDAVNRISLVQCEERLVYPGIVPARHSLKAYRDTNPLDHRYDTLIDAALRYDGIESLTSMRRLDIAVVLALEVPCDVLARYSHTFEDVGGLVADNRVEDAASLVILQRFGLSDAKIPRNWTNGFRKVSFRRLERLRDRFGEHARCEFDKCVGAVFAEVLAVRGDARQMERVARYYRDGKHVPMDQESSLKWFTEAARKGSYDATLALVKMNCESGDVEEAERCMRSFPVRPTVGHVIIGNTLLSQGDEEGAERSFRTAFELNCSDALPNLLELVTAKGGDVSGITEKALRSNSPGLSVLLDHYLESEDEEELRELLNRMRERDHRDLRPWSDAHPDISC